MAGIRFHYQDIDFKLKRPRLVAAWLASVARREKSGFDSLEYIFCNDQYLLQINKDFLNHTELTDIITFNYSDAAVSQRHMEGEIYISIDRVRENAQSFKTTLENELHRVMVHGVLHLCGYNDKTPAQKRSMREKEDASLSLRQFHVKH
jgi:probable rRNA maturation factor